MRYLTTEDFDLNALLVDDVEGGVLVQHINCKPQFSPTDTSMTKIEICEDCGKELLYDHGNSW